MKKILLTFYTILFTSTTSSFAQLSGAAQVLYDSAYAQDPVIVNYASTNGAQIMATSDSNSFYIQWFPTGATPNATPIVVTLHGSDCNAFMEFKSWHPRAQAHGCGIIALQWNRYNPNPPYDYFPDDTLYNYIDSALTRINYPSNKALLHGFSRGSARSYAMIFNDIQSGNNYFCTTISNSGGADIGYPLYDSIDSGVYGPTVFAGKRWNLFCGGMDTIVGCVKMTNTQTWLQSQGAIVDIFIQDPALDHDGFQLPSSFAYKDSILNNYLQCYNGTLSVNQEQDENTIRVFPNPSTGLFTIQSSTNKVESIQIINTLGEVIRESELSKTESLIDLKDISKGIYFLQILNDNQTLVTKKIIITY